MDFSPLSYAERAAHCLSSQGKRLLQLMDEKKTNLALSLDVTDAKSLLAFADLLGPQICLLKTHIDIINDFTPALTVALQSLAKKHQFLLFEDRKFADIGHTVKHQYAQGVYRIVEWADIINAHALPGPSIVQGLAEAGQKHDRGLILIAEMSSTGHLMDAAYQQNTLAMAKQFPDFVLGFITQHALSTEPQWINLTPGIQLQKGNDDLGQQYTTPEKAILEQGTDVIIVGRGIMRASHPAAEAAIYRGEGWQAYQRRLSLF